MVCWCVYKCPIVGCQNPNSHSPSHHNQLQHSYAVNAMHLPNFTPNQTDPKRKKDVANENWCLQMWWDITGLFIQWGLLHVLSTDLLLISSEPQEKTICLQVFISYKADYSLTLMQLANALKEKGSDKHSNFLIINPCMHLCIPDYCLNISTQNKITIVN